MNNECKIGLGHTAQETISLTPIDREYIRRLDENPQLASEQCRGFLLAVCDNFAVQLRRERPELTGRPLALAVARRLYASDEQTQALLDMAEERAAR
jgi:hypothetical protein